MDVRLSRRRELDLNTSQMDDKIASLQSQLDKGIHDVVTVINQKHVEFLPQTMFLNVQFTITQAIAKAKTILAEVSNVSEDVERQLADMKESPRIKLNSINAVLAKLEDINALENLYEDINSDNMEDPVFLADTILKAEKYLKSLEGKDVYEPLQKVLPGLTLAFSIRKGDIVRRFNNNFLDMIKFPSNTGKASLQLYISRERIEAFNKELHAMHLLGILDEKLGYFADEILETFVTRILDSRTPSDNLLRYELFPDNYSFLISNNIAPADDIDPLKIIGTLTSFFENLSMALSSFKVNDRTFVQLFGEKLATKLIDMMVKDCLTASVPYDESKKK